MSGSKQEHIIKVSSQGAKKAKKEIQGVSNGLRSMAKSAAAAAGAYFGARALLGAVNASIDAFKEQELSEKKLEAALGKTSQALLNQASALQKVTMFGDEAIITAQALIGSFVRDEEAISLATEATLDLAAAKGMDLTAAADLVSKTLGSSTNALSRYGIEVTGAVGSTERLNSLTENIANVFGGQAAAQAETLTGAMVQLNNAFGDLQETLVTDFAPNIESTADTLSFFIESLTTKLKLNQIETQKTTEAYRLMGASAKLQLEIANEALLLNMIELEKNPSILRKIWREWDTFGLIVQTLPPQLNFVVKALESLGIIDKFTESLPDFREKWEEVGEEFGIDEQKLIELNIQLEESRAKIAELQAQMAAGGEDGEDGDPIVSGFEAYEETMNKKFALMQEEQAQNEINQEFMAQFIADNEDVAKALGLVTDATKNKIAIEKEGAANFKTNLEKAARESKAFQKLNKALKIKDVLINIPPTVRDAYAAGMKTGGPAAPVIAAAYAATAFAAQMAQLQQIKKAQYGADFVTDGPQMMMVGEGSGPERVQVTPLADPNIEGPQGQGITLNINNPIMTESFVEDNVIPQIREGLRLGENMGV